MEQKSIELIRKSGLFDGLEESKFNELISDFEEVTISEKTTFIKEGETADALYIIEEGVAQVFTHTTTGEEIVLARLEDGAFFGEQALLPETPGKRNANVRSLKNLKLFKLNHLKFQEVLQIGKELKEKLKSIGHHQLIENLQSKGSEYNIAKYIDENSYETKEFNPGETLIKQGDPSDEVFIILSGDLDLFKTNEENEELYISSIPSGSLLGEVGVIENQPRAASVKAKGQVLSVVISGEEFRKLYQTKPEVKAIVEALRQVYQSPKRGEVRQYTGEFLGMTAIISKILSPQGMQFEASRVIGRNISSINRAETEKAEKVIFEGKDVFRTLLLEDSKLVGVVSYGEWPQLANIYDKVFEGAEVTEEELKAFKAQGQFKAAPSAPAAEEDDDEIICNCMYVSRGAIKSCIDEGATTTDEVSETCGAGSICGACIPEIEGMLGRNTWQALRLGNVKQLTEQIRSYQLFPIKNEPLKDYQAGQHIVLQARIGENWVERSYTLTSASGDVNAYEVAIKKEDQGLFSRWLFDHDKSVPFIRASHPTGKFTLEPNDTTPLVCLMAGIGITPAVSFARTIVKSQSKRPLHIYYTGSSEEKMAYIDELSQISYPPIKFNKYITKEKGRMNPHEIRSITQQIPDAFYFICGPEEFESMCESALKEAGISENNIFIEQFTHAGGP